MRKRLQFLLLPVLTLALELLPWGAVCNFARPATNGTIGHFRSRYSYFDLTPFGYANFAPLITAVLSCLLVLMLVVYCIKGGEKLLSAAKTLTAVCAVISLGPLLYGLRFYSLVGGLISLTLMGQFLWLHLAAAGEKNQ